MKQTRTLLSLAAFLVLFISACSQPQEIAGPELEPQFGTPLPDQATRVAADLERNTVYVAGRDSADERELAGPGGIIFLRRYSQAGELVWEKRLLESEGDNPLVTGLQVDAAGHVYLAYTDYSYELDYQGATLLKFDASGEVLYELTFDTEYSYPNFGIYDFDVDPAGNAYLVGSGPVEVEDTGLETRNFVRKYDAQGQLVWERLRDVTRRSDVKPGDYDLGLAGDGSLYVYGQEQEQEGVLTKYSSAGETLWQLALIPAKPAWQSRDLVKVAAGAEDVYLTISREAEAEEPGEPDSRQTTARRYHADGSLDWQRTVVSFGSTGQGNLDVDDRGNVYFAGRNDNNLFVYKYSADGAVMWTFSPKLEDTVQIAFDVSASDGRTIYTAGSTTGSVNGEYFGRGDAFLLRLNAQGEKVWSR